MLSTKNDSVDEINDQMIDVFQGEEKVYYSFDMVEDDHRNFYLVGFLNALTVDSHLISFVWRLGAPLYCYGISILHTVYVFAHGWYVEPSNAMLFMPR